MPSRRAGVESSLSQYVSASDGSAVGLPSKSKVEMEAVSKPPNSMMLEDTLEEPASTAEEKEHPQCAGEVAAGNTVIEIGEPRKL